MCELDRNFFSDDAEDGIIRNFVISGLEDTLVKLIQRHMNNDYRPTVSYDVEDQANSILNEFIDENDNED